MKALIQRVKKAQVEVDDNIVGKINQGLLVFVGVEKEDTQSTADKLLHKLANYRIFSDDDDKMNRSVLDINGDLLMISQFTLVANTNKGMRPSFSSAADPQTSKMLYDYLVQQAKKTELKIQTGIFAANMQVSLINDGPVTFNLTIND